jgi:hypothetical protein
MTLKPPPYVPVDRISHGAITYKWNDRDHAENVGLPDEQTKKRLRAVSNWGVTAFAIGCAEWVIYRFNRLFTDRLPYDYLEAFWVFVMGNQEALPGQTVNREWLGPIRGPMNMALMTVLNTVFLSEDASAAYTGAVAELIALLVLNDATPFLNWRDQVLDRLMRDFPRDEDSPDGPPVPREILDPSFAFSDDMRERLISAFLRDIDYKANPLIDHLTRPN